jgi:3-hydroxyisobutyrate dehydrogenase-like beta-hydroxyacid dehydrogenase
MMPSVGFFGVGQMGRPMVDRLAAAGVPLQVYVRRPELRAELVDAGIPTADSLTDLAACCDVLILCLFDDGQVRSTVLDAGVLSSLRPGSVVATHVTGSPHLAVELQDAAPAGVTVLDVPISGTADHIRRGELTLLVGGDPAALERARPAFETYAHPILHVGGLGDGQRMKLLNNLVFTANLLVVAEAARLGRSLGIEPPELSRVVGECSGASFALGLLQTREPEATVAGARRYLVKDVEAIRATAEELGADLGRLGELAGWVYED